MSKGNVNILFCPITRQELVAFLSDTERGRQTYVWDTRLTAKALGVQFQIVEVKSQNPDFEGASRLMVKKRIGSRH